MPQPFQHPKTHVYYFRKVVPKPLRKAVGRTEIRTSLRTKDWAEAKRRFPQVAAEVDARLALAGGPPIHLTHKQTVALASTWYRRMLDKYDEEPGDEVGWEVWADQLRDAYHEDRVPMPPRMYERPKHLPVLLRLEG